MKHTKVLNYVNKIRVGLGKKPLAALKKGYKDSNCDCPISKSLGSGFETAVDSLIVDKIKLVSKVSEILKKNPSVYSSAWEFTHPKYVSDFIVKFDCGEYPELELEI